MYEDIEQHEFQIDEAEIANRIIHESAPGLHLSFVAGQSVWVLLFARNLDVLIQFDEYRIRLSGDAFGEFEACLSSVHGDLDFLNDKIMHNFHYLETSNQNQYFKLLFFMYFQPNPHLRVDYL